MVIFRHSATDSWRRRDADRLYGMIIHAIVASLFCFLPFLFAEFMVASIDALRWCSGLLALASVAQVAAALHFESRSSLLSKSVIGGTGGIVVALQALNSFWISSDYVLGVYLVGVFWWVTQAAVLFVMLSKEVFC